MRRHSRLNQESASRVDIVANEADLLALVFKVSVIVPGAAL